MPNKPKRNVTPEPQSKEASEIKPMRGSAAHRWTCKAAGTQQHLHSERLAKLNDQPKHAQAPKRRNTRIKQTLHGFRCLRANFVPTKKHYISKSSELGEPGLHSSKFCFFPHFWHVFAHQNIDGRLRGTSHDLLTARTRKQMICVSPLRNTEWQYRQI